MVAACQIISIIILQTINRWFSPDCVLRTVLIYNLSTTQWHMTLWHLTLWKSDAWHYDTVTHDTMTQWHYDTVTHDTMTQWQMTLWHSDTVTHNTMTQVFIVCATKINLSQVGMVDAHQRLVKGLWLCLWELWHSIINANNGVRNSHKRWLIKYQLIYKINNKLKRFTSRGKSRVYPVYPWIQPKIKRKSIFITIIQLGKGKWWLETILMFLD